MIRVSDHAANECHLLDLGDAAAKPVCAQPRAKDLRYSLAHRGDELFIRTNADGAEDYKIVRTPLASPGMANWVDVVPHERGRMITGMTVYPDHLVRQERHDGLPRIVVRALDGGAEYAIAFPEEAYSLSLDVRRTFATTTLRFTYASMTTPRETFDFDLATRERTLRKRQSIPSGHDPYALRDAAPVRDGRPTASACRLPCSTAPASCSTARRHCFSTATAPMATRCQPASAPTSCRSSIAASSTLWRTSEAAQDKGWHWYLDGKLGQEDQHLHRLHRRGAHALIVEGYTAQGRIVALGRQRRRHADGRCRQHGAGALRRHRRRRALRGRARHHTRRGPAADPAGMARVGQPDRGPASLRDDPRLLALRQRLPPNPIRRSSRSPVSPIRA